jgi:hypothetical protein
MKSGCYAMCLQPCGYCPGLPSRSIVTSSVKRMKVDFKVPRQELPDWKRWRPNDQAGLHNLLGTAHTQAWDREIGSDKVVQLSIPVGKYGPAGGRFNPVQLMSMQAGDWGRQRRLVDDWPIMRLHSGKQWDSLSHNAYDHQPHSDFLADQVGTVNCAKQLKVDACSYRIVVWGVLIAAALLRSADPSSYACLIVVAAEPTRHRSGEIICRTPNLGHGARTCRIATTQPRMTRLELVNDDSGDIGCQWRCYGQSTTGLTHV